jgi:ketosteroid isomerase-like protein
MAAPSPDEAARTFVAALNSSDLDTALAQWSEDAVLLPAGAGSSPVEGKPAIRGVLAALIEAATEMQIVTSRTYIAGQSAVRTGRLKTHSQKRRPIHLGASHRLRDRLRQERGRLADRVRRSGGVAERVRPCCFGWAPAL